MSADKYPSIFSRQMKAIVYIYIYIYIYIDPYFCLAERAQACMTNFFLVNVRKVSPQ